MPELLATWGDLLRILPAVAVVCALAAAIIVGQIVYDKYWSKRENAAIVSEAEPMKWPGDEIAIFMGGGAIGLLAQNVDLVKDMQTLHIGRLICPRALLAAFYKEYGDVTARNDCRDIFLVYETHRVRISRFQITAVGSSVVSGDMTITEQVTGIYYAAFELPLEQEEDNEQSRPAVGSSCCSPRKFHGLLSSEVPHGNGEAESEVGGGGSSRHRCTED